MSEQLERTLSRYEQLAEARKIVEGYEQARGRLIARIAICAATAGWWCVILGGTSTSPRIGAGNWLAAVGACLLGPAVVCGLVYIGKRA